MIPAWIDGALVPVDKREVHLRGLLHPAVSVFVLSGERLLVQRRAPGNHPGAELWSNTCCAHPHWGEAPVDCAVRRMRDELGIDGIYPAFAGQIEFHLAEGRDGTADHELVDVFVAYLPPGVEPAPNPAFVTDLRWIGPYDLAAEVGRYPERFSPWLRAYLPDHLGRIIGAILRM